jgi:hypothetical protein
MTTPLRRFACAVAAFALLCTLVFGQGGGTRAIMPASRLAEMREVKWSALTSAKKAVVDVRPSLTEAKATLKVTVPGYEIAQTRQENADFVRVDVPGAGVTPTVGRPELPVVRRFLAVPDGARVSVTFKAAQAKTLENVQVYPVQPPLPEQQVAGPGPAKRPFAFAREFYGRDQAYPEKLVTVSEPMRLGDLQVVLVEIAIMQHNGGKKTLSVYPDVEVSIAFSKPFTPKQKTGPMDQPKASGEAAPAAGAEAGKIEAARSDLRSFENLIVDWDLVRVLPIRKAGYLIITPDVYYSDIQSLVNWKQTKGLAVLVAKLSAISAAPTPTQIRDHIKNLYQKNAIRYVLLVGDTDTMPAYTYTGSSGSTVTDYFYTLVSGSDFLPDVALGRFSGRELANLTTKTVNYEKTPPAGAWRMSALCISDTGYFENTSNYNAAALQKHGFTVDKIYASLGNATAANVANAIAKGRLLVSYRGHGAETSWATTGFANSDVAKLMNGPMLPVIISPTCLTGCYDFAPSDCFAECWVKSCRKLQPIAAVAYWGSARVSYGGYNDELSKGAFDEMLGGDHVIGNVVNKAKLRMISTYGVADPMCLLELHMFNLFGDPNLTIAF